MSLLARLARLLRPAPRPAPACCGGCKAFDNDPQNIEAAMPGLRSLGSATASVRAADGLCLRHDRYIRASSCCADFTPVRGPA